ncbi:M23 family metallopeptidase [Microbacterium pumilum]|uniref:M23 family metallopeptidase n=1 Tax=Microbacterium pumilum TaxID=344165 RepID=UPI0031E3A78A
MPTRQRHGAEAPEDLLAEAIDSPANDEESAATSLTRRSRARSSVARPAKAVRPASRRPAAKKSGRIAKPIRSLAILTMVGGLVATIAIPAFGAASPQDEALTVQQVAADNAQSLVVASDASASELTRESYSATTQEEIDEKKAKEAAAAAAAARARQLATAAASSSSASTFSGDITLVSPGSGEVRWPLLSFIQGRGLWDSGYHQGQDMLAPAGTPIYAAAAGVVRVSQESFGGYGVCVTIDHVIGGQQVSTLYGHMTYGTRLVQSGQTVAAGQMIGQVGSTGSSTANHLHFEVHINGSVVDPLAWLNANAG